MEIKYSCASSDLKSHLSGTEPRDYLLVEVFVLVAVQRLSVQQDLSVLRFIQPLQEADAGRLPSARGTHESRHLPRAYFQREGLLQKESVCTVKDHIVF